MCIECGLKVIWTLIERKCIKITLKMHSKYIKVDIKCIKRALNVHWKVVGWREWLPPVPARGRSIRAPGISIKQDKIRNFNISSEGMMHELPSTVLLNSAKWRHLEPFDWRQSCLVVHRSNLGKQHKHVFHIKASSSVYSRMVGGRGPQILCILSYFLFGLCFGFVQVLFGSVWVFPLL